MKLEEVMKELEDIRDFDLSEDATGREAIQEAIKALEKQIPMKPMNHRSLGYSVSKCPCCGGYIWMDGTTKYPFCWECGQAIDWSEVE